jgi:hypothetical protein
MQPSPKGLPGPHSAHRRVVISAQAPSTAGAPMPANGQASGDHDRTASMPLAGERRIDRDDSPTGACRLVAQDAQERAPPRTGDALGEMVIPEHVGRLPKAAWWALETARAAG